MTPSRAASMSSSFKVFVRLAALWTIPALAALGCKGSSAGTGGLYVTVKDASMATVADAMVSTEPATQTLVTDALGTVLFPHVPAGFYSVTAVGAAAGTARVPVTVTAGALAQVTLVLRNGPAPSTPGAPSVHITAP